MYEQADSRPVVAAVFVARHGNFPGLTFWNRASKICKMHDRLTGGYVRHPVEALVEMDDIHMQGKIETYQCACATKTALVITSFWKITRRWLAIESCGHSSE
jgi:hypothetical protein